LLLHIYYILQRQESFRGVGCHLLLQKAISSLPIPPQQAACASGGKYEICLDHFQSENTFTHETKFVRIIESRVKSLISKALA